MAVLKQTSPTAWPTAPGPGPPARFRRPAPKAPSAWAHPKRRRGRLSSGSWPLSCVLCMGRQEPLWAFFREKTVLRDDINNALKDAQKAKNERTVSTLRMVNSTLKNADIEARGAGKPPLGDSEVLPVLQKMIKQRQESVELYQKGNRADLVKQEQEEIAIISGYLPKQMSEAEMTAAIEDTGATGMKDMGKVIGALRGKYAGQMDMAKASALVKAKLQ